MDFSSYIRAHAEELVGDAAALIRIPSTAGEPEEGAPAGRAVQQCLNAMLQRCAALGFRTGSLDGQVGWCEYGEGAELIAIPCHLDVVPAGEGWTECAPFAGEVKNGRLYGRGAMDDKGPAAAAVHALAAVKASGAPLSRRVRILFGTSEETGCADMAYYRAHGGETPVMGFTPDGEFPLINGEKGIMNCTYACSLHQTGAYRLIRFEGGTADNVVPAHAAAELACPAGAAGRIAGDRITVTEIEGGIRVEAEGVSAHGSTPEQGENAVGRLAQALLSLPLEGETGACIAFLAERIGLESGGESLGLAMHDDVSGRLTFNLGTAHFAADTLTVALSVRYPVTAAYEEVHPRLARAMALGGFAETAMHRMDALYLPPESELVKTLLRVYDAHTGGQAAPICIGGGTYAKELPNTLAFGPVFPGDEVREHQADEYISVEQLLRAAEIYADAIYALAK